MIHGSSLIIPDRSILIYDFTRGLNTLPRQIAQILEFFWIHRQIDGEDS
jgi:hypothetical protein